MLYHYYWIIYQELWYCHKHDYKTTIYTSLMLLNTENHGKIVVKMCLLLSTYCMQPTKFENAIVSLGLLKHSCLHKRHVFYLCLCRLFSVSPWSQQLINIVIIIQVIKLQVKNNCSRERHFNERRCCCKTNAFQRVCSVCCLLSHLHLCIWQTLPMRHTVLYTFYLYVCVLGIEPLTFVLLMQCLTNWDCRNTFRKILKEGLLERVKQSTLSYQRKKINQKKREREIVWSNMLNWWLKSEHVILSKRIHLWTAHTITQTQCNCVCVCVCE